MEWTHRRSGAPLDGVHSMVQDRGVVNQISVRELQLMLQKGEPVLLVDVREPWEHRFAKLPGSVLIPLGQLAERAGEVVPPAGAKVVTYCHHGIRSLEAAAQLAELGHDAASLAGGIERWSVAVDSSVPRY